jgi:hypothetical protein
VNRTRSLTTLHSLPLQTEQTRLRDTASRRPRAPLSPHTSGRSQPPALRRYQTCGGRPGP